MGDYVVLAKYFGKKQGSKGMTDIEAVNAANALRIQINTLAMFNAFFHGKSAVPFKNDICYSSKWIVSEAKSKKISKSGIIEKTYPIDGIRRVADLNMLGLSQYIGEANLGFFVDQIPDIGNGKPNLEIVMDGKNAVLVVNDLSSIAATKITTKTQGYRYFESTLNADQYFQLFGTMPESKEHLLAIEPKFSIGANNRLIQSCNRYRTNENRKHYLIANAAPGRFGVQGVKVGKVLPAMPETGPKPVDFRALRANAENALEYLKGVVDADILAPIRDYLKAIGK